jgi:ribokinase
MPRVVVLGSVNRDLVFSVRHHVRPGETLAATGLAEFPGGKGANQAVASARAGANTVLVGAIGGDGFGQAMSAFLGGEGIDLAHLVIRKDAPTGMAAIAVDAAGQNSIIIVPGANASLEAADAEAVSLAAGDVVVAPFEVPDAFIRRGFERARAAGARTLLNPAPMRVHDPALLDLTDCLVLNETEFAEVTGSDDVTPAALLAALPGIETVILTLGPEGALVRHAGVLTRVSGHRVDVVDTTGAGDCFVGVLAASLAAGVPLQPALQRANRGAAISVTRKGAGSSMPSAAEING